MTQRRRTSRLRRDYAVLLAELEELREDNARLRLEATRPLGLPELPAVLAGSAGTENETGSDDGFHLLAEAQRQRSVVKATLAQLRTACVQLERQLELGVGPMELERRQQPRTDDVTSPSADERAERAVEVALRLVRELRADPAAAHRTVEDVVRTGTAGDVAIALAALVDPDRDPEELLAWTEQLDARVPEDVEREAAADEECADGTDLRTLDVRPVDVRPVDVVIVDEARRRSWEFAVLGLSQAAR